MPQSQSLRDADWGRCPRVFLRCDLAFLPQFGCRTNHIHMLQSMVSLSSGNQAVSYCNFSSLCHLLLGAVRSVHALLVSALAADALSPL